MVPARIPTASCPISEDPHAGGARAAQLVALEEREVVVPDLVHVPAEEPTAAPVAAPRLGPRDGGRDDVLTSRPSKLEIGALAGLAAPTDGHLVDAGAAVARGGHQPDALGSVEADRSGVLAVGRRPRTSRVAVGAGVDSVVIKS